MIQNKIDIPSLNFEEFKYGFWATYADQEKRFLRRNADVDLGDRKALEVLFKKNIKIIFLLLKQYYAEPSLAPCKYDEVLTLISKKLSIEILSKLQEYVKIREDSKIAKLSHIELIQEIKQSLRIFHDISTVITKM